MPLSPYAAQKLAAECMALAWASSFGLRVLSFRFFNVFGPLQRADHAYAAVIPKFMDSVLRTGRVSVHGDGRQTRDFTYVDSVTEILSDAIANRISHPAPVNLAFGGRISLLDIVESLRHVTGIPIDVEYTSPRPGDVRDSQADNGVLRSLFPLVKPVPVNVGLERTWEWFLERAPAEQRQHIRD